MRDRLYNRRRILSALNDKYEVIRFGAYYRDGSGIDELFRGDDIYDVVANDENIDSVDVYMWKTRDDYNYRASPDVDKVIWNRSANPLKSLESKVGRIIDNYSADEDSAY